MQLGVASTPSITSTIIGDIYTQTLPTDSMLNALLQAFAGKEVLPEDLIMTVETVPLVYLVWAGATLLTVGMATPLIKEFAKSNERSDE